jgi:two-component sensor histidine kinase
MKHLFFYLLLCSLFFAQALHIGNENIDSSFQISYLKDLDSKATIYEIQKLNFNKQTKSNFNLGYHKGTIWFKILVTNRSDTKDFILTLNEHFYEKANLYYEKDGALKKLSNSLFKPVENRDIRTNQLAFDLELAQNTLSTLYLELQGKYAYFGNVQILQKNHFYAKQTSIGINHFFTFVLGVIFVMIFFTLFLYSKTKENIYLYYLGYSFFLFVFASNISGLLVFIDLQKYIYDLQLAPAFMMGFLILFSREYLETKKYLPKFDRTLMLLSIPFFILGVLIVYSYQPWNKYINNLSGLICVVLIVISTIVYLKGHRQSKFYVLAMVNYLFFVVLFTFMVTGVLEYSFLTRQGFVVGVAIEMLFFSYLLANRYHLSKQSIQNYLEKEVALRTNELKILADERELLLKEVFHRVKNNFHMIIGMLHLEKEKKEVDFLGLINRIKSMSTIHEYLYTNKNLSNIQTKSYLEKLTNNIQQSYPTVDIVFVSDTIFLGFDHALSLGIIINEVVTNSIKHNEKEGLSILINLTKDKETLYLKIVDNGSGFDETIFSKGLGLKLIKQFCKKLPNSKSKFSFENGTIFELQFESGESVEK